MTRRNRWLLGLLILLTAMALLVGGSMPYLPWVHGTAEKEVERLTEWLGVRPGSQIADVGAGSGKFSIALARRVGTGGKVYATELDPARLAEIRQAATAAGLSTIEVIEGAVASTNLPAACCDAIFSRAVYHHLTEPAAINDDLRRALRPGGRLLVIDFEPGGVMDWIGKPATAGRHGGHGTPKTTVVREVTAAGFERVRGPARWRGRTYAVLFRRP
jgi:ubiquinone/menaquinone biosynthesis C-methylase UbiE